MKAVGVEFDAHRTKIGHDLVELRAGGELGDGAEPFGGLFCRRADGTKPGTGGLPGGPELLKSLRGNPGGLCRPAEVRLDLLQGSVDDGKIAAASCVPSARTSMPTVVVLPVIFCPFVALFGFGGHGRTKGRVHAAKRQCLIRRQLDRGEPCPCFNIRPAYGRRPETVVAAPGGKLLKPVPETFPAFRYFRGVVGLVFGRPQFFRGLAELSGGLFDMIAPRGAVRAG